MLWGCFGTFFYGLRHIGTFWDNLRSFFYFYVLIHFGSVLECFGPFWEILGHFGPFYEILGNFWYALGSFRKFWDCLGHFWTFLDVF